MGLKYSQLLNINYSITLFFWGLFLIPSVSEAQTTQRLFTPCYVFGPSQGSTLDALVSIPAKSTAGAWADGCPQDSITHLATHGQIGSTWGLAYNKYTNKLYAAAFIKRHVGIGPNGTGAIYQIDPTGATAPSLFVDLNALFGANTAGADPHPYGTTTNCPNASGGSDNFSCWFNDVNAWAPVGREGLGDLDISEDGQYLYVMNMTDKTVYQIPTTNPTAGNITKFPFPASLPGATITCHWDPPQVAGQIRPMGLGIHNGKVYAGAICTGEVESPTGGSYGSYLTYIYELNPSTGAWVLVLEGNTQSDKNSPFSWPANFTDTYADIGHRILSDIEFDNNGHMLLGFRDMSGDRYGNNAGKPIAGNGETLGYNSYVGNIVKACYNAGTGKYDLEVDGSCGGITTAGPADGFGLPVSNATAKEYFFEDQVDPASGRGGDHPETSLGGIAFDASTGEVWVTSYDLNNVYQQGIMGMSNTTGARTSSMIIIEDSYPTSQFGKANGLGDLELSPAPPVTCTAPTAISFTQTAPTCTGATANNDGKITFTSVSNADKYFINSGATSTGTYATASAIPTSGTDIQTAIPNTGGNYTIRFFNGSDACFKDTTITVAAVTCTATCSISLTTNVSSCYDSNGNTAGGSSVATVQAIIDWTNNPTGETINITCTGATTQSIDPTTSSRPAVLNFVVPSNGATVTVTATFSTTTTCTATQNTTAPSGTCLLTPCEAGNTGGVVWRDFNNDGIKTVGESVGVSGVTVKAFDNNGNLVATTTTDYLGQYTFTNLSPSTTNKYRIEFSNLPPQYKPTANGTNGRTDVQFISSATCNLDFGVNNSYDYCAKDSMMLGIPCYVNGNPSAPLVAAREAFVFFNYKTNTPFDATTPNIPITAGPTAGQLGSVWGGAYQRSTKTQFSAAVLRRHMGFGALGIGGIYAINTTALPAFSVTNWIDVKSIGIDVGNDTRDVTSCNSISTDPAQPAHDIATVAEVGKRGIGDIDYDEPTNTMWLVNMKDKKLYGIKNVNPSVTPTASDVIGGYPITLPTGFTCESGVLRPWAVKSYNGKVYVGAVCDASLDYSSAEALNGYVLSFDPTNPAAGFKIVSSFSLAYEWWGYGGATNAGRYYGWEDMYFTSTPIISNIEFDVDGSIVLGIMDRTGLQLSAFNYNSLDCNNTSVSDDPRSGDIKRLCNNSGVYSFEGTAGCPVATNPLSSPEWYWGDYGPVENTSIAFNETAIGGLTLLKGSGQVMSAVFDPTDWFSGGVTTFDNQTGGSVNRVLIYQNTNLTPDGPAKGNGLGEMELLCNVQPIEIGNYVWLDTDNDGVQDPNEAPLSNITVTLWKGGTQIASTTTDANGEYYFSDKNAPSVTWTGTGADTTLLPSTAYEVRILMSQTGITASNYSLTTANSTTNSGDDQNDSDASLVSGSAVITLTTGLAGSTNHTYDFGFVACTAPSAITFTKTAATCTSGTSNNNGKITFTSVSNADKYFINSGAMSTGTYATASAIPAGGTDIQTGIPNTGGNYTIRFFNGSDACYKDTTITISPVYCPTPCVAGSTGGKVWVDYNANGAIDGTESLGVQNVTVKAYDCNGTLVATTTTDYLGQYTFGTTLTYPNSYRIEFSNLPPQYQPTYNGTNGRTDVQFVSAASCSINFGVNNPADYCQTNPLVVTPCYINGNNSGTQDVFVGINYDESGSVQHIGTANQIGSTWGVAYRSASKTLFTSAVLKRHAGFGKGADNVYNTDDDISAIYVFNNYSGTGAGTVSAVIDMNSFAGVNVGSNPRVGTTPANDLPSTVTSPSHDYGVFGNEGKRGIGDIDVSEDGNTLYVLNLNQKALVALNVSNPTAPTLIGSYPIPNPSDMPTGDQFRPWAIGVKNGSVYIGGVTDASSTQLAANLRAYVMKFNGSSFTTVDIDGTSANDYIRLDYDRLRAYSYTTQVDLFPSEWMPWTDNESYIFDTNFAKYYAQPILSDIEFTDNGSLVLGFLDRTSFQMGNSHYAPTSTNTNLYFDISSGEILQICNTGGLNSPNYVPEGVSGCTQNSGTTNSIQDRTAAGDAPYATTIPKSFYNNISLVASDGSETHNEISFGGLAIRPGSNAVVMTAMNPADILDPGPRSVYNSGGFRWLNTTSGSTLYNTTLYSPAVSGSFGKATGLGDVELTCNAAPLQIGNYVWIDADKDGVQDPCEPPLSNITVTLWKGGTQIASTTTNANGEYYFSDKNVAGITWTGTGADTTLLPSTAYEVRILMSQTGITTPNYSLTTANATTNSGNDQNDSDASVVSGSAVITLTTGLAGSTNHTYDFGFVPCTPPSVISLTQTAPTCTGATANNDGKITFTSISNADRYFINSGATSTGTYATASAIPTNGTDLQTSIANTGGSYTIRFFNGSDACFKDTTVIVAAVNCSTGCAGNLVSNGSLESGLLTPFSITNSGFTATGVSSTLGGSNAVDVTVTPSNLPRVLDAPITGWRVQNGSYVDAASNGGLGSQDGNRFYYFKAIPGFSPTQCSGPNSGLGFTPTLGQCYKICTWVAVFDPANPTRADNGFFDFEMNSTNGVDVGTLSNFSQTPSFNGDDNSGGFDELQFSIPASLSVKDITGAPYTGAPGQVVDWKTLNWVQICFDLTVTNTNINYTYFSRGGGETAPNVAIDDICITPCAVVCTPPTFTGVSSDTATCTNGVANNDAAVHVTGITGMAKYAYSTNGTTGLYALTATASTASSINLTGLTSPSVSTTYTFRLWGTDTTCYNDTTVVLNPSVCPITVCNCQPAKNVAYICGSAKGVSGDNFDHGMINYLRSQGNIVTPIQITATAATTNAETGAAITFTPTDYDVLFYSQTAGATIDPNSTGGTSFLTTLKNTLVPIWNNDYHTAYQLGFTTSPYAANAGITLNKVYNATSSVFPAGFTEGQTFYLFNNNTVGVNYVSNYFPQTPLFGLADDNIYNTAGLFTYYMFPATASIGKRVFYGLSVESWSGTGVVDMPTILTSEGLAILNKSFALVGTTDLSNVCPSAGADQSSCQTSAVLTGTPTGGTWTQIGTSPIVANISGSNVTGMTAPGVYQFVYTKGICNDTVAITVLALPTIGNVNADTATCTNGVANNNAAVHVTGIIGMTKYAYSTNGTTGLYALTASASTASSIDLTGLANPSVATTYTFRLWGTDTTCYNDTTVVLTPSVCPQCSITGTFTQNTCNNNGTAAITTDDYFRVTISSVSTINGGTSGKYEVVLNGTTVLNTGGTAYGSPITVGGAGIFAADGTTTYSLTIRDFDNHTCTTTIFTTTATQNCSVIVCPPQICIPVTVTRMN